MSCCIYRRKPVPERTDRGGTLRYAWLRAPPIRQMLKTKPKPRSGRLTQKPSYEGGQRRTCAVPTIYRRSCFLMVGTLSLCPPYALRTDLPCEQAQSRCATATNQHDGKSLLIFRNRVKPETQKYSAFVFTQISRTTPPVSRQMRGASRSSRTRGEMRWTLRAR